MKSWIILGLSAAAISCGTQTEQGSSFMQGAEKTTEFVEIGVESVDIANETLRWTEEARLDVVYFQRFSGDMTVQIPSTYDGMTRGNAESKVEVVGIEREAKVLGASINLSSDSESKAEGKKVSFNVSPTKVIDSTSGHDVLQNVSYTDDVQMMMQLKVKTVGGGESVIASKLVGTINRNTGVFKPVVKAGALTLRSEAGSLVKVSIDYR